jgi:ribonuclease VapC
MVIDTSAVLAILQREPERRTYLEAIEAADTLRMSVASYVEGSIVIESRYGTEGLRDFDRFVSRASIELVPVDEKQGQLARSAFSRFGKGRHRAGLNYGDCFSYAAAISLGEPLLCKGDDFIHTDVPICDYRQGDASPARAGKNSDRHRVTPTSSF